jgi:hypothetical protein
MVAMQTTEKLYTAKELAGELGRSYRFVFWMRKRGFEMPGGTATLAEARAWLRANPQPCRRSFAAPLATAGN